MQARTVLPAVLAALAAALGAQDPEKPKPLVVPGKRIAQPAPAAQGKQPSQEDLKKQREEKLAKEVFKKAPWTFDYDAARAEAKKSGKLLFTYFTRSYAH